jgi:hypothetical protein
MNDRKPSELSEPSGPSGSSSVKFVQIATSVHGGEILLYALDESGDVWRFDEKSRQWVMLPRDRR